VQTNFVWASFVGGLSEVKNLGEILSAGRLWVLNAPRGLFNEVYNSKWRSTDQKEKVSSLWFVGGLGEGTRRYEGKHWSHAFAFFLLDRVFGSVRGSARFSVYCGMSIGVVRASCGLALFARPGEHPL
jgi:hypothetical protein